MRLDDPAFRYPSGLTHADMDAFHRQWDLDHPDPTNGNGHDRPPWPYPLQGEADPTLDDDDAYAARMASEEPICWCPLCSEPLYLGVTR